MKDIDSLIISWFRLFQPTFNVWDESAINLYLNLIQEEVNEYNLAVKDWDSEWIMDAICDIYWVSIWYDYFSNKELKTFNVDDLFKTIYTTLTNFNIEDILKNELEVFQKSLLNVCASNYTKSFSLQTNWEKKWKVIKWINYIKPNLKEIVDDSYLVLLLKHFKKYELVLQNNILVIKNIWQQ